MLAKRTSKRITTVDPKTGGVVLLCNITDMDKFKNFAETMEYRSSKLLNVGDKVKLDAYGDYFVIDAGYSEQGEVEYLIGR